MSVYKLNSRTAGTRYQVKVMILGQSYCKTFNDPESADRYNQELIELRSRLGLAATEGQQYKPIDAIAQQNIYDAFATIPTPRRLDKFRQGVDAWRK